jgi:hypothetical protein
MAQETHSKAELDAATADLRRIARSAKNAAWAAAIAAGIVAAGVLTIVFILLK